MANIKKLKANGEDIVPITHEQAVLDSNGVTLDSKLNAINNAISRLENNSTSNVPSLEGNALTFGNYTIKYNETDDTLDFIYNDTTEEPEVPPTTGDYVTEGLSLYIDAADVATRGSIVDITGNQTITNNGVSTTLDNGCLNFVASESDYLDCGFVPNLSTWSTEIYAYFTSTPTDTANLYCWGSSKSNRIRVGYGGSDKAMMILTNITKRKIGDVFLTLQHLVVTANNGTYTVYINGVQQYTFSSETLASHTNNMVIGTSSYGTDSFADMNLKSFRFYDGKVLSDAEVLQNYNYEINRG